jgi:hypothetical protein
MTQDKIDTLRDLSYELYNAEDVIDGCYNPEEYKDDKELTIINETYRQLLSDMNDLISDIEKVIGK